MKIKIKMKMISANQHVFVMAPFSLRASVCVF